jgi:sterol desaturase/sphingolipid hydroxylase (fatty acid hydroxylase superfamily)
MKFDKIHNKGQAQIFENKKLEYLTKGHPMVIWGIYLPVIIYMVYYSLHDLELPLKKAAFIFLGGIVFWTLAEYFLHRFVFHIKVKSESGKRFSYIVHGNHHHYPRDKQRLFMPPFPSIVIALFFFFSFYIFINNNAFAFFPGFMLGYLSYASMHYAIHAWHPPFKWLKPLWRNHHLHHYKNEDRGFGVSSTLWDHIFGTMFDLKNEKEDKEKVNELMFDK